MARPKTKENDILSAAIEVFHEKGFSNTSIQDIANRAGIGKGTIYEYFKSKEELFINSIKFDIMSIVSRIKASNSAEDEFFVRMSTHINVIQDVLLNNVGRLEFFFIRNVSSVSPDILNEFKNIMEAARYEITKVVTEILNQGIAEGKVCEDIDMDTAAYAISGMVAIHCDQWQTKNYTREQLKYKNEKLLNLIMCGIGKK